LISFFRKYTYSDRGELQTMLKSAPVAYTQTEAVGQTAPQIIAVHCPGCGANNIVAVGRVSECENCRTPINV